MLGAVLLTVTVTFVVVMMFFMVLFYFMLVLSESCNVNRYLTRCPNRASARQWSRELAIVLTLHRFLGDYCVGVPPLPIPNREVKPVCADGTAMRCGRVGGCPFSYTESLILYGLGLSFLCLCLYDSFCFVYFDMIQIVRKFALRTDSYD